MHLYGLLDSPFVRRVAVTLEHYGLQYQRTAWSVYRNADTLSSINPLITAPVLELEDGTRLIDSHRICEWIEENRPAGSPALTPTDAIQRRDMWQVASVANLVCEKVGQLYRELSWRPSELHYQVAIDRMRGQIYSGLEMLEQCCPEELPVTHASIMAAITRTFVEYYRDTLGITLPVMPSLDQCTERLELTEPFKRTPLK